MTTDDVSAANARHPCHAHPGHDHASQRRHALPREVMSKGKRLRQRTGSGADRTQAHESWAGAPRVQVRQAIPPDLPAIAELAR